mgnify:CR=1 FL=1
MNNEMRTCCFSSVRSASSCIALSLALAAAPPVAVSCVRCAALVDAGRVLLLGRARASRAPLRASAGEREAVRTGEREASCVGACALTSAERVNRSVEGNEG